MIDLGKPKLFTKFEVASSSHCVNIDWGTSEFWGLPYSRTTPLFSACDFMMSLGKPQLHAKFEVASFSRCRNIKGKPHILRSSPSPGPHHFLLMGLNNGPRQNPGACQMWYRWIYLIRKYKKIGSKWQIRFFSYLLGELKVTYGLHL